MTKFEFEKSLRAELHPIRFWLATVGQTIHGLIGYAPIEKRKPKPATDDGEETAARRSAQEPFVGTAPASDHRFSLAIHNATYTAEAAQSSSEEMTTNANYTLGAVSSLPADS
jgi:hypothetical protein